MKVIFFLFHNLVYKLVKYVQPYLKYVHMKSQMYGVKSLQILSKKTHFLLMMFITHFIVFCVKCFERI